MKKKTHYLSIRARVCRRTKREC